MHQLEISTKLGHYNITLGQNLEDCIVSQIKQLNPSKIFIISDSNVVRAHKENPIFNLGTQHIVPAGETYKNLASLEIIWQKMLAAKLDRNSLVLNFGGGVVGDLGGFAASSFMRGLRFIQIPSTLLAQVDASVGGKVGIDFNNVKNLIGNFAQPSAVFCDLNFLQTLKPKDFISGLSELIKHGLIADKTLVEDLLTSAPLTATSPKLLDLLTRSLRVKTHLVAQDELETAGRKLLNLGHTIGHALESFFLESATPLLHGEAVSIGIVLESKVAQELGMLSEEQIQQIITLLEKHQLPTSVAEPIALANIIDLIHKDKKNMSGNLNLALLTGIGSAAYDIQVDSSLIENILKRECRCQ